MHLHVALNAWTEKYITIDRYINNLKIVGFKRHNSKQIFSFLNNVTTLFSIVLRALKALTRTTVNQQPSERQKVLYSICLFSYSTLWLLS